MFDYGLMMPGKKKTNRKDPHEYALYYLNLNVCEKDIFECVPSFLLFLLNRFIIWYLRIWMLII